MSRGGRRGGFGGGGRQSSTKVAGVDLPWEFDASEDPAALLKAQLPTPDLFPPLRVYRPSPATSREWACVQSYKSIRESIHDAPYYAILGETSGRESKPKRGGSASARAAAEAAAGVKHVQTDPFEGGMTTFSHRYKKLRRRIPNLGGREYNLRFFPKELWPLLDASNAKIAEDSDPAQTGSRKRNLDNIDDDEDGDGAGDSDQDDDDQDDLMSVDEDDDYEEDEDDPDDDNDYNAEKYFDGGDDDYGDDGEGGGGGGAWMD